MGEPTVHQRACALYPNQGMHAGAMFIADLHPQAIDYLEQAPVLAASFGAKRNVRADRLYIASRIGGPIQRGEKLRVVLAAAGIPRPLRKLKGSAIMPFMMEFVRALNDIDSSTLAQVIPEKPGAQQAWLRSLRDYRERLRIRRVSQRLGFTWMSRHAHLCEKGQSSDIADFIASHPSADIDRWSFERMNNEVTLWHDRLAADRDLKKYGSIIMPDTVIDLSDWPDHADIDGFEFLKLATPSMLMEEGRRMRHCVASYIPRVMAGDCHIYSVRREMRRMATMEIVSGRVVQLKGHSNRLPSNTIARAANSFLRQHAPKDAP